MTIVADVTITQTASRRYVLGRQGLWPGRRWQGLPGTAMALRAIFIYPMDELPYWRVAMQRKGRETRWANFARQNPALLKEVKAELRKRGPLGNRDFEGRATGDNYRSGKDSGLAMYYLWLTGELMTRQRRNFERVYDFRQNVAPRHLNRTATIAQAENYFARKTLGFKGLSTAQSFANTLSGFIERRVSRNEVHKWLDKLVGQGAIVVVQVEGWKDLLYALSIDAPFITAVEAGGVPDAWQPLDTTTNEEVVFLAPLDIVSARGRAKILFDFDYIWEVYKPAHTRRWGYYTLPILYGDQLVARFDPKLDRTTNTLVINGLWLEEPSLADDPLFIKAFANGLNQFKQFLNAARIDLATFQRGRGAEAHLARSLQRHSA